MKTIDHKYRIKENLGQGFGGSVYLVEDPDHHEIALKQLKLQESQFLSREEVLESFKQEFTTLKKLSHPHILRILDFGYDADKNLYYFTTEYISGEDIFHATRNSSPEEMEDLFVQSLRALNYLHSQNIYHLDIKPSNIMVTQNSDGKPIVKLIDFGLAAFRKKGVLAGTPGYIAPEALLKEPQDSRSDLYSLGVTLYTCLKGKNPFEGKNLEETLTLQRIWMPPPLSAPSNGIPAYTDQILSKLLKKNPNERYHHAAQVIRDINWGGSKNYPLETDATALSYLPGEGRLVGRDEEWRELLSYYDKVFVTKSDFKSGLLLSGAPGTGKSRLLKELKYHAQLHNVAVLEGRDALSAPLAQDSLILVDEADPDTLQVAERRLRIFHQHSLMILLAGEELHSSDPIWQSIILKNFDPGQVTQYVSSVLGLSDPPASLVDELYARTEGNPLLLTLLLQSLIQSHQLFDEQGRWSAMRLRDIGIDFAKLHVPQTLAEYRKKKYDQLNRESQRILLAVSFAKAPLTRHDLQKIGIRGDSSNWDILLRERLIRTDLSGQVHLINPNFRDWMPPEIDSKEVAHLHQRLADLFQNDFRKEASWYHSGFGEGGSTQRFKDLLQYGDSLTRQSLWRESIRAYQSALALATEASERVEARLRMVSPLFRSGQQSNALAMLQETNDILRKEKENPQRWRWVQQTLRVMGGIYIKEGRLDLAHESLQASRVLLEEHEEDPAEVMMLDNLKASLLMREGKIAEAASLSEQTYHQWRSWPLEKQKEALNNELASIYMAQGKISEAKEILSHRAELFGKINLPQKQAYALYGIALCCYSLQQIEEAIRFHELCAEISRKTGNEELLFHVFNELGNIAFVQKNWTSAATHYQHALELARHLSDEASSFGIAINLALVLQNQGDANGAQLYLKHVIGALEHQPSRSLHLLQFLVQGYLALGPIYMEKLKWTEARDAFRDAMNLIQTYPALDRFRASALIGLVQADIQLHRIEEAQTFLTEFGQGNFSPDQISELDKVRQEVAKEIHT